mgnify:CR=1 FL=1
MKIEVKGVQFENKGAALMLHAIHERLTSEFDGKFDLVLSPRNSPYKKRVKFGAMQKIGSLRYGIDWSYFTKFIPGEIKLAYGLCDHEDIDITLDASGFAYGDQWTLRMLKHSVRQAELMKKKGRKYILMPQALGPFTSAKSKELITRLVIASELVFIRDPISFKYIEDIVGDVENIRMYPDFTNLLKVTGIPSDLGSDVFLGKVLTVIPNSKMIVKGGGASGYLELLEKMINDFQVNDYKIIILNHEGVADRKLCLELIGILNDPKILFLDRLDEIDIKKVISNSKVLLSSRFHGCVSGLSQGVVTLGTSWSHKYEALFKNYGVEDLIVKEYKSDLVDMVLKDIDNIESEIDRNVVVQKRAAEDMWQHIYSLLRDF